MTDLTLGQNFISDAEFRSLVEQEVSHLGKEIGETAVRPRMLVADVKGEDGQFPLTLVMFEEFGPERHMLLISLGMKLSEEGRQPVCAILTSDAWMRSFTPEEARTRRNREVASYEDKTEALIVMARTIDGRCKTVTVSIERDENGAIHALGEPRWIEEGVKAPLLDGFFQGFLRAKAEQMGVGHD